MASIKDVAKEAGVGVGTVSRYLNNNQSVSDKSSAKIEAAIARLNYIPNELARNLSKNKTGIIAVIEPDSGHPYYSMIIRNIQEELAKKGYKMMLCNTYADKEYERVYLDMLKRQVVDGIITGAHSMQMLEKYADVDRPIVALDCFYNDRIPIVTVDHKGGGKKAAELLYKAGCRKVLQFHGDMNVKTPSRERHAVFEEYLKQRGVEVFSYAMEGGRFENEYYKKIAYEALEKYEGKIDGVFATDLTAAYFMQAALKKRIKVPEELKIVAYDGTYITETAYPTITAIEQPFLSIARSAVQIIDDMINGKEIEDKNIVLDMKIKKGATV